ncbi:MAG: Ldh family oxidoreductase [Alphaproteobacteria bacterium]|nr:Ldh family oxidoreductase [Alphaproteobacteria bacterium]
MNVPADRVHQQILGILLAWGMERGLAETSAQAMVDTDLLGVESHGISMLMKYEDMARAGKLNLSARPRVVRDAGPTALLDGDAGLGHPVASMAMNLAVDKAKAMGVGVVGVRNSHHFGAAGVYARIAASRGAIGMVTSATQGVLMVPTRGAAPVLGTNPIAFAAPAARNRPFVLDMATTTVAGNKVKVYALKDKPLPVGWVVDRKGQPITDPHAAREAMGPKGGGGITPIGGTAEMASHKGYGLAVMAHILGGALTGASFSPERNKTQKKDEPDNLGHFFMAIDPGFFRDAGAFEADLDTVIDTLHATPPADPAEPVLVAGDPEAAEREKRLREGIPIPASLHRLIREICTRCNAPYLLE